MKAFFVLVFSFSFFSLSSLTHAQDNNHVVLAIGEARPKKTTLFLKTNIELPNNLMLYGKLLQQVITNDLTFSDRIEFKRDATSSVAEFSLLLHARLFENKIWMGCQLKNRKNTILLEKNVTTASEHVRSLAHDLANQVYETLFAVKGIFHTKIAASCDGSGKREIYLMDYDGSNVKRLTYHNTLSFAPAWSPDAKKIAYSAYRPHAHKQKNIDLLEVDIQTKRMRPLSWQKGINSGATYTPDGRNLVFTMSKTGLPMLYILDLLTLNTARLSPTLGFDVDPYIHPSGSSLLCTSGRSGPPMVYSLKMPPQPFEEKTIIFAPEETAAQSEYLPTRLTYAGQYNATPSFSPDGKTIIFAGWIDGHFDIFQMNSDGTHIVRLTRGAYNNEDPHISPDGSFIVYSSNRTGKRNLYIMDQSGRFKKRLTFGLGNCTGPKWSPFGSL